VWRYTPPSERFAELEAKEGARTIVAAALSAGGYGSRELVLRVNPLDTPWGHADLAAAATMPIDAVLLPKVESADRVRLTLSLLDALGAPERLAVWCMVETPLAVLAAREIAASSPRLAALVLGTSDLTKELHALVTRDRLPLITSLGLVMLVVALRYRSLVPFVLAVVLLERTLHALDGWMFKGAGRHHPPEHYAVLVGVPLLVVALVASVPRREA